MLKKSFYLITGLIACFVILGNVTAVQAQTTAPVPESNELNELLELPAEGETEGEFEYQEPVKPDEIPADKFYRAVVTEILDEKETETGESVITTQRIKVRYTSGDLKDQEMELENDGVFTINAGEPLEVGQKVLVYVTSATGQQEYYVADTYRVNSVIYMLAAFFALAIALSRWKGVASIAGLALSVAVIVWFIVPQIIAGRNPLVIILIGALMIALVSIYLAHGFNRRTTIAVISTVLTLGLAALLAGAFVNFGQLFGLGSEEAFYVQQLGALQNLNLRGLLLGGIILGALGVLDDITTAQTATVYEIKRANPALGPKELMARGLVVGREHVNSLVNTLFLAYAGASLPLFLFFTVGGSTQPIWVTLNSEFIVEEIVRTLVGSMALMMAVPITTFMAAYYFGRRPMDPNAEPDAHTHAH